MKYDRRSIIRLSRNGKGKKYIGSWIFCDKIDEAGDNAEYFYEYALNKGESAYFIIKKGSEYNRLKERGFNLLAWGSDEHLLAILNCKYIIHSQDHVFDNQILYFNRRAKFVFLQHGVTMNNMSKTMNLKKMSLFITSTRMEYNNIALNKNYNVGVKEVKLTGFARHDRLLSLPKSDDYIFIFPTWRFGIKDLKSSNYYKGWMKLFDSLKELSKRTRIVAMIHSFARKHKWEIPDHIEVINGNIGELIAGCSTFITDYSSTSFEAAYIYKPVIYYQFDEKEFRTKHYPEDYFSYHNHGFGPVVENENAVLEEIKNIEKNGKSDVYKERMEEVFQFRDGKCCERIYNEILKLNVSSK